MDGCQTNKEKTVQEEQQEESQSEKKIEFFGRGGKEGICVPAHQSA